MDNTNWFDGFVKLGTVALQSAGQAYSADANAQLSAQAALDRQQADAVAFQRQLLITQQSQGNSLFSGNGPIIIMLGVAALFVIGQSYR